MKKNLLFFIYLTFSGFNFCIGQITFQKTFDSFIYDAAYSVCQTTDSGYIIAGNTGLFGNSSINGDAFLAKMDMYGDTLWTKTYGDTLNACFNSVDQTVDGGYIAVGNVGISGHTSYLVRTDATGDTLWTRAYSGNFNYVQQTSDGGFAIAARDNAGFGIMKMNSIGNIEWTSSYNQPSHAANALQQTNDGGYIVVGSGFFGGFASHIVLGKFDNAGILEWLNYYGNVNGQEGGFSVVETNDGSFVVAGGSRDSSTSDDELLILKTDAMGNLLWSNAYEGGFSETGHSIHETGDGGFIVCGNSSAMNYYKSFLIKTDSGGTVLWTKTNSLRAAALATSTTYDGGYVISGSMEDSAGSNTSDFYIEKTDSLGNSGCNQSIAPYIIRALVFTTWSGVLLTIPYNDTTSVATGTHVNSGCVLTNLCADVSIEKPVRSISDFTGYFANNLSISFSSLRSADLLLTVTDITGRTLFQNQLTASSGINKKEMKVGDLAVGIYIVTLIGEEGRESVKISKE